MSLACTFLAVALTAVITVNAYRKTYNGLIRDLPQRIRQYSALSELDELVRGEYFGEIDHTSLDEHTAEGFVEGLDDPHSFYIAPEGVKTYKDYLNGHIAGIGASFRYDSENVCIKVSSVEKKSAAADAGLKKGDMIFSVDGENVTASLYPKLVALLGGEAEKSLKLGIMDIDDAGNISRRSLTVNNGYDAVSCTSSMVGKIGYIRLSSFYSNTYDAFAEALDKFIDKGAEGIILDVRDNSSTDIETAVKIIDRIVPLATEGTGAIATARNSKGEDITIYPSDSESLYLPAVVLVNGATEGAAELLACDLRDFGKARIVGEQTAGNGTAQKMFMLDGGGAVVLSVAKIYPYISDCFDGTGIAPDDKVSYTPADGEYSLPPADEDAQFQTAYAFLTR